MNAKRTKPDLTARYFRFGLVVACLLCSSLATAAEEANPSAAADETVADENEAPKRHAYKLGDFRLKNYRPVEREKVKLQFTVYIELADGDEKRFEKVWKNHEHRVRNQIITAARLVPSVEYDDPKLHLLHRRIYLRLRRAVPQLPLGEIYVSDFSYLVD